MKKLNIKIIVASILFIGLTVSCSDDFVDVVSSEANSEDFFNSEEEYQSALVGAYDLDRKSVV